MSEPVAALHSAMHDEGYQWWNAVAAPPTPGFRCCEPTLVHRPSMMVVSATTALGSFYSVPTLVRRQAMMSVSCTFAYLVSLDCEPSLFRTSLLAPIKVTMFCSPWHLTQLNLMAVPPSTEYHSVFVVKVYKSCICTSYRIVSEWFQIHWYFSSTFQKQFWINCCLLSISNEK